MVRNIVGSLLEVGSGKQPEGWIREVLAGRDRSIAGPTAPASGLEFLGPLYPAACGLPDEVTWPAKPGPRAPEASPADT
jgi:tRNA pseudouridine38-40 synthase